MHIARKKTAREFWVDIYLTLLFPLGNFKQELLKSEAFSKFQEAGKGPPIFTVHQKVNYIWLVGGYNPVEKY